MAPPAPKDRTQPESERVRGQVLLRLSAEARAALHALAEARGVSRSAVVEGLVLAAASAAA